MTMTTIKVDTGTRDMLREVAERDGVTMDTALRRVLRREWLRQAALELSARGLTVEDRIVMDAGAHDAVR